MYPRLFLADDPHDGVAGSDEHINLLNWTQLCDLHCGLLCLCLDLWIQAKWEPESKPVMGTYGPIGQTCGLGDLVVCSQVPYYVDDARLMFRVNTND
jgi:hypothetical protein